MNGSDRAIRWSTAVAVLGVAVVAAVVSYQHGYEVVRTHGESASTARLVPLTVDGLIYASSMVMLHSARSGLPVPALARWLLGLGITATLAANVAHGWAHGPIGAAVAAWPAIALVGSYELLMWLIRTQTAGSVAEVDQDQRVAEDARAAANQPEPDPDQIAVHAYQAAVRAGTALSERKLAAQFGKSRRWARKIIAIAREPSMALHGAPNGELLSLPKPD